MSSKEHESASEIFLEARELPPEERSAFLSRVCVNKPELLAEVESLLAAERRADELFGPVDQTMDHPDKARKFADEGHPAVIGPYKILETLGEGGMGIVYLAEQERPIRRRVAIKIIKLGMETKEVIARFESERQALAIMNHPNIAKVFDAGATEQGRPYFVMEYVPGIPITRYCDQNRLANRERLRLFMRVCEAVQHAHQNGIIHRDLKPSNVLVAVEDGNPVPKVIDFGVAKATSQRLTERTLFTRQGALIGTPEYMSPEQAEITPLDVDTRSDIYSLGVLLYELLVGALPFDRERLRLAAFDEIRRIVREEDPPKPSTRASGLGNTASEVALRRRTEPGSLARELRGELDWIVMKTLEKDRSRRYASASELAAEIERYLQNEPVSAGPPSAAYRLRKLASRHKTALAAACMVFLALVAGLAGTTGMFLKARTAEQKATAEKNQTARRSYLANLHAAVLSILNNDVQESRQYLAACISSKRGWEWRHLFYVSDSSLARLEGSVESFTPDGSGLITAHGFGPKKFIRVWNTLNFSPVRKWDLSSMLHEMWGSENALIDHVNSIATKIVAVYNGESFPGILRRGMEAKTNAYLIDLTSRKAVPFASIYGYMESTASNVGTGWAPETCYSSDSRWLAVWPGEVESGNSVAVFDAQDGSRKALLRGNPGERVSAIALASSGTLIAVGFAKGVIRVWDFASSKLLGEWRVEADIAFDASQSLSFSGDARLLAAGTGKGMIHVFNLTNGREVRSWMAHDRVSSLDFGADETRLASGGDDGVIALWNASSGERLAKWRIDTPVSIVRQDPKGMLLAASGSDETTHVWDIRSDGSGPTWHLGTFLSSIAVSSDSTRVACGLFDNSAVVLDMNSGKTVSKLAGSSPVGPEMKGNKKAYLAPSDWGVPRTGGNYLPGIHRPVYAVAYFPDSSKLVTVGGEKRIWNVPTEQVWAWLESSPGEEEVAISLAISPDGQWIAAGFRDNTVKLWHAKDGTLARVLEEHKKYAVQPANQSNTGVPALAFRPDGKMLASGDKSGNIILWSIPDFGVVRKLEVQDLSIKSLAFDPSGMKLYGGLGRDYQGYPGSIAVWDAMTGETIATLSGHRGDVRSVSFSPDGTRFVSAGSEGTVRVWDASTLESLLTLRWTDKDPIEAVAFTPDGTRIVAGSLSGQVHVWETRSAYDPKEIETQRAVGSGENR